MSRALRVPRAGAERMGCFVISLDFEIHWGVRDQWELPAYQENLLGVRTASVA